MTRGDKGIFFLLLIGSLAALFYLGFFFSGGQGSVAVVEVNGKEYGRYALEEKEPKTLAIKTEFGYNNIMIENGKVWVNESDCPDGLEIREGAISHSGEMLVCLPNRLVIRILGRKEVDGFAY